MRRDPRLRPLSRDHYHALVLARFIGAICARDGMDAHAVEVVRERFAVEITPHFRVEETLLVALEGHGVDHLVARTRKDHATMLRMLEDALAKRTSCMCELGELLAEHVRFEERELYPACEQLLSDETLERIAAAHAQGP
jgi:hemerythrin-like domain-containing protein